MPESTNKTTTNAGACRPSLFFKMRLQIAKIMLPSAMTPCDFVTYLGINLSETVDEKLTVMLADKIVKQAQDLTNSMLASNLKDVSADTLESLILANSKITDLQKSQISAILTAPTNRTDYLG